MLLTVIDCPDWHAGRCVRPESVARYGDRPSAGVCVKACGRGTLTGATIAVADPKPMPGHTSICLERIAEEWRPDWRARLHDAGTVVGNRLYVPDALYAEAMRNRR